MKFEDFEAGFVRENRKLKLYLVAIVGILAVCLVLVATQRKYFIYSGGELFKERLLTVDICKEGFTQIIEGNPSNFFVTDGILKILKKSPFLFEFDEVLLLKEIDKAKCRYVAKRKGKLYSFLISLEESNSYPFYYKVNRIDQEETKK